MTVCTLRCVRLGRDKKRVWLTVEVALREPFWDFSPVHSDLLLTLSCPFRESVKVFHIVESIATGVCCVYHPHRRIGRQILQCNRKTRYLADIGNCESLLWSEV